MRRQKLLIGIVLIWASIGLSCKRDAAPVAPIVYSITTYTVLNTNNGLGNNFVDDIVIDASGTIWFATVGGGVSTLSNNNWKNYTTKDGLCSNYVKSITIDSKGNKWFATSEGVSVLSDSTWTTYNLKLDSIKNGMFSNDVMSIVFDKSGNPWIGTWGGGISVLNLSDTTWNTYLSTDSTSTGLANNDVYKLLFDSQERLWIGTVGGLGQFNNGVWENFTMNNGLSGNEIMSIALDNNIMWLGTNQAGITWYDGSTFVNYTQKQEPELRLTSVDCILVDSMDQKWFGSFIGLAQLSGTSWEIYNTTSKYSLVSNHVYALAMDKIGQLWIGTDAGVCVLTKEQIESNL